METLQLPTWSLLGILVIFYVGLDRIFRFRTLRNLNTTHASYLYGPYSLDYKTAHLIMKRVMLYEAP
jgi:hypothetical protein